MNLPGTGRRAFLRGVGATLALPWLETLSARLPKSLRAPPRRVCVMVTPNGMLPSAWHPAPLADGEVRDEALPAWMPSRSLAPLLPHADRLGVYTGLVNRGSFKGDGHYAKVAPLLTGQTIRRTGGRDIRNGVSFDQLAAQQLGGRTMLPSLELGCDRIYPVEDMGYSTVYGGHIAWSAPDRPVLKEIVPRQAFDRLFRSQRLGAGNGGARQSVLDAVRRDRKRLAARLSARDQHKLEEYEDAVRRLELRLDAAAAASAGEATSSASGFEGVVLPEPGKPADYPTHVSLMLDVIELAFRCDATRIITFLTANEVSGRSFDWIEGCAGNFHAFSHHQNKPENLEPYAKINLWHVEQFAQLLDRLSSIEEGEDGGNVLDNTSAVLAAAMSDGNAHSPKDLPIVLAGGGHRTGRIVSPANSPLCGLWLALLRDLGATADRFGDASEALDLGP